MTTWPVLISHKADISNRDIQGARAVDYASTSEVTSLLWSKGCIVNTFHPCDLHTWCFLLNCGAEISHCSNKFGNAIIQALYSVSVPPTGLLRRLFRRLGPSLTAELVNWEGYEFGTPLYLASMKCGINVIQLLCATRANIDAKGGPEGTALMVAVQAARLEVVRFLINCEASIVVVKDNQVFSAVSAAWHHRSIEEWFLVRRFTERNFLVGSSSFYIIA